MNGSKAFVQPGENIEEVANANAGYQAFKAKYPKVTPWDNLAFNKVASSPEGSQMFQFKQNLLNGCHGCAVLGVLDIGYRFDRDGNYTGIKILGVEPDETAPHGALIDSLAQASGLSGEMEILDSDGNTIRVEGSSSIEETPRCTFAVYTGFNTSNGWFALENKFTLPEVDIQRTSMISEALFPDGAPLGPAGARASRANGVTISCRNLRPCISQDYTDKRGRADSLSALTFGVLAENVDVVVANLNTLRTMCPG